MRYPRLVMQRRTVLLIGLLFLLVPVLAGCMLPGCPAGMGISLGLANDAFPVTAWVDENQNGAWDDDEPPLEGVSVELSAFRADPCGGYFAISTCTPPDDYKAPPAEANESYSFFGQVVHGIEILPTLTVSDIIQSITIDGQ